MGADQSFSHALIQLTMNMNVDIHLINRFNVGCQSVSGAYVNFSAGLFEAGLRSLVVFLK